MNDNKEYKLILYAIYEFRKSSDCPVPGLGGIKEL